MTILTLLLFLLPTPIGRMDRITGRTFATRSEVIATHGMAATSQPLATQVAIDILKAGGSAVDAAIAANAMLCLVEPTGCGLGGDLFAIVWDAGDGALHGLNASGRSPAALTREEFEQRGLESCVYVNECPIAQTVAINDVTRTRKINRPRRPPRNRR